MLGHRRGGGPAGRAYSVAECCSGRGWAFWFATGWTCGDASRDGEPVQECSRPMIDRLGSSALLSWVLWCAWAVHATPVLTAMRAGSRADELSRILARGADVGVAGQKSGYVWHDLPQNRMMEEHGWGRVFCGGSQDPDIGALPRRKWHVHPHAWKVNSGSRLARGAALWGRPRVDPRLKKSLGLPQPAMRALR